MRRSPILRGLHLVAGVISLTLALIGALIPIVPTTPFLLLAAFFFLRSSESLHRWLKGTSLYRENLEGVAQGRGMTRAAKTRVLTSITLLIAVSDFFMIRAWLRDGSTGALVGALVLVLVWLAHIIGFVHWIPTRSAEDAPRPSPVDSGPTSTEVSFRLRRSAEPCDPPVHHE